MVTCVVTGFVWITQVLKLIHLVNSGARFADFCIVVTLILPSLLFVVLPFSTAIAAVYIYNRLYEERQLLILKNAGLSNIRLAKPALMIAACMTLFSYYISFDLLPNSYVKLKSNLNNIRNNYASSIIHEKSFSTIAKSLTVYVDKKESDGLLKGIVLFDNRVKGNLVILFASQGKLWMDKGNPFLELKDGSRQAYDENGNITRLYFESSNIELMTKKNPSNAAKSDLNEYHISELFNPDKNIGLPRQNKLIAEGHQRLVWPLYCFILTFLGLAVFLRQPYNKKSSLKAIIAAAASFVVIIYIHFTLQNLISKNSLFITAYYANLVIANITAIWFYRQKKLT